MPILRLPSAAFLRECFSYNRRTGILRWKPRPRRHFRTYKGWAVWNANNAGRRAGNIKASGHRRVRINSVSFEEHRVVWKMIVLAEPRQTIDHIDGNPSNNRLNNLRSASDRQQKWNAKLRLDNRSGFRGVHPTGNRWLARIASNGEYRHLGCFATKAEASAAYETVARKLHGEFYRRQK